MNAGAAIGAALLLAALGAGRRLRRSPTFCNAACCGSARPATIPPSRKRDAASGDYAGFDIDLAESLGKALGVRVEFVADELADAAAGFRRPASSTSAMGGISVTLERAKLGFFTSALSARGQDADRALRRQGQVRDAGRRSTGPTSRCSSIPAAATRSSTAPHLHAARIAVHPDNTTIFDALARGEGDLMITDASETRYQQKLHPGVLCAIHPDAPFDFGEKAYWAPYDPALDGFLDQWLHHGSRERDLRGDLRQMVLRIAAFVAVWSLYFIVTEYASAIHNDMAEAYAWGREFQLGYNQHPPFWAWMCGAVVPRLSARQLGVRAALDAQRRGSGCSAPAR